MDLAVRRPLPGVAALCALACLVGGLHAAPAEAVVAHAKAAGARKSGRCADRPRRPACRRVRACRAARTSRARRACLARAHRSNRADKQAPKVTWRAPADGAQMSGTLSAAACEVAATDNTGVARVDFSVDGRALNRELAAPYQCVWDTAATGVGTHVLKAVAYDAAGNAGAASRTVQVVAPPPAPTTTSTATATPTPTASATPTPTPTASPAPAPDSGPTGPPVAYPAKLSTTPTAIVDANRNEVLLRGFDVIPVWADNRGSTWGASSYTAIRDKGFNAVRFAVYWSDLEPVRGSFDATHLATLDRAISYAKAASLYVILDPIHLYDSERYVPAWARTGDALRDVETYAQPYLAMLADRYRNEAAVAAYDPINEPPGRTDDQSRILDVYGKTIAWMRARDPDKIVFVEPAWGDSSLEGDDFGRLGTSRNVALSVHDYYAGGAGDGYATNGAQEGTWTWDEVTGYPVPNAGELEQHVLAYLNVARAAGLPVWIGEFGINPAAVNADRWIDEKVALFKKYRLGYAWWAYRTGDGLAAMDSSYRFKPFVDRLR